ncbi:MAG: ABC-F family ATP-binding cassette domain-containing protein, partial [Planctomycetales bacterium]|nr:ABC-F family ATP-binding cassette domain-containing protein [Planctomycetales bacterium]
MVLLSASRISKTFGDRAVLREVNLELRSGDHVALVGPNGTGKTTLLKILTGQLEPDRGDVQLPTAGTIGYLQQHPQFDAADTVWSVAQAAVGDLANLLAQAEQVAAQLAQTSEEPQHGLLLEQFDRLQAKLHQQDAYNWEHRVERVLQGLGFAAAWYSRPAHQLSGGQQNRLMLACLLLQQPDLMILDEPNNHLDIESTEWLETTLADWPGAFLLVSHDRFFLDQTADAVLELVSGQLDRFRGNYSAYVRQKAERIEVQRRTYEKNQEEIAKLEDFVRKHHHGQKSTQAEDRRKKLERIELVEPPREIPTPRFHFPAAARAGDIVLRATNLAKAYDKPLFEKLNLQIERGERWAIVGSNGSGKSTLLKCLLGQVAADRGEVKLGTNLQIGYFDQLLSQLPSETTAAEAIRVPHRDLDDKARRSLLGSFGISGELATKPLNLLSGGEKNRTMLAWLSAMEANFLVLDEPTNHLDLWSRHALEEAIKRFDGTVLLVTHDRYLVNAVADHILVLHAGRVSQVAGNYDAYR